MQGLKVVPLCGGRSIEATLRSDFLEVTIVRRLSGRPLASHLPVDLVGQEESKTYPRALNPAEYQVCNLVFREWSSTDWIYMIWLKVRCVRF